MVECGNYPLLNKSTKFPVRYTSVISILFPTLCEVFIKLVINSSNYARKCKMVNGTRYRALESVSMASALSSALTIYPCQIRVHQR